MDRKPHLRDNASALTRLLESVKKNVIRISSMMSADLAEVFQDLTSKTALAVLEKYSVPENIVKSGMDDR
ncbi:MAG: hypothetical protein M0Z77_02785 [Thermoplasmatales archaeon]|nr:hypothetical protein [Thermoplasmatales archaeon]